ncbi:leucine-rich repeat domain-containing protein [Fulvivirga maritima]|uniref:leucine-rich repeat domain-containing protein n=1 Tax=Fulvivirga maritima TaxID=2904247 RepID=UPI001F36AA68|nr:leucine-rich repeat domain-containing protein [Fulvivirga maritima]UII27135.1 leucine-rich repeat domain-containing protein [Fulvivirga maritima]
MKKLVLFTAFLLYTLSSNAQYILQPEDLSVNGAGIITRCTKKFSSGEQDIIIPESVNGITIRGIRATGCYTGAFYRKGIRSVQFPATIEFIGNNAFRGNPLISIDLSRCTQLRYIGLGAFYQTPLESVDLSGCTNLEYIGEASFYQTKLENVDFANCTNLESIERFAFAYSNLSGTLDLSVCQTLTQIGDYAFTTNKLEDVRFDDSNLIKIGSNAFYRNEIQQVDLSGSSSLQHIGAGAFRDNQIQSVNISNCTSLTNIEIYAFEGNSIQYVEMEGVTSLTQIKDYAFANNALQEVNLSQQENLQAIGEYAFANNSITALNLGDLAAVTTIGTSAFSDNQIADVQDLSHFNNLNYIGAGAFFNNLSGLTMILPQGATQEWRSSNNQIYHGGNELSNLSESFYREEIYTLTDGDVTVTNGIIQTCNYDSQYKSIIIPDELDGQVIVGLAEGLFQEKAIYYVKLPSGLKEISAAVFKDSSLEIVDMSASESLEVIGEEAFENTLLAELNLQSNTALEKIGEAAFRNTRLSSLNLAGLTQLKEIGASAFYNAEITSLHFENCVSLTRIENSVFADNFISEIGFAGAPNLEYLGANAFGGNSINTVVGLDNCANLYFFGGYNFDEESLSNSVNLPQFTTTNSDSTFWRMTEGYLMTNANDQYEIIDFKTSYSKAFVVSFQDFDGNVLKNDTIIYNESAVPPKQNPQRSEYIFAGYSPQFEEVKEPLLITAQYLRQDEDHFVFKLGTNSGQPIKGATVKLGDEKRRPIQVV